MFRLFGFDVAVRPGFLFFCALIVFVYQDSFGLWLAGALAGFTLLHELGHAIAARSAGAKAAISLDFMAGYTSFQPTRPIRGPLDEGPSAEDRLKYCACDMRGGLAQLEARETS